MDRSLRLSDAQHFQQAHPKDLIVLHHTAGGSARSTFHIATAYIVERHEPRSWLQSSCAGRLAAESPSPSGG